MSARPLSDAACYRWKYAAGICLCLLGAALGLYLPDIDLKIPLPQVFLHRSILTHSPLLPLLLLGAVQAAHLYRPERQTTQLSHPHADPRLRLFALGASASLGVHFCFDLFPRWWHGFALIHVPVLGRMSVTFSYLWLLGSAIVCLYVGCRLLRRKEDLLLAVGCLGGAWGMTATNESQYAVSALLALLILAPLAFVLPRGKKQAL